MHVVEHILLRPKNRDSEQQVRIAVDEDFFSFRLSVVFPAWTARFQDQRFRQLARETVRLNCPAQVVPEVLWLGFDDMLEFERLQTAWMDAYRGEGVTPGDLDAVAARLADFLLAHRGEACWALAPSFEPDRESGE